MWVDAEWTRRGLAALHAMLDVDEHTRKAMIQFLFDEGFWNPEKLTWDAAIAKWNDAKNPAKPGFWKVGELWRGTSGGETPVTEAELQECVRQYCKLCSVT